MSKEPGTNWKNRQRQMHNYIKHVKELNLSHQE